MAVNNIFAPERIEGESEARDYVGQVLDYLDGCHLESSDAHPYVYSLALREACAAVLTGSRGVGCVITSQRRESLENRIVAIGRNDLSNADSDLAHVAHAEVLAIQSMRKKNREIRESGRGEEYDSLESTLWSTLGPCPMCMIACINQRIGNVVTIASDWTGGVTMNQIAAFEGFRKKIDKYGLRSFDAPIDLVTRPDVAQQIRRLCWAVSRVKHYRFDADEFHQNQDLLTHDALSDEQVSIDDLMRRLEEARAKRNLPADHHSVTEIARFIDNAFGSLQGSDPILPRLGQGMTDEDFKDRIRLEIKVLLILNLIRQLSLSRF